MADSQAVNNGELKQAILADFVKVAVACDQDVGDEVVTKIMVIQKELYRRLHAC